MLEAKNVSKSYGSGKVLHKVNMQLQAGTIYGLLGPNGAGKSTLFKILCRLVTPDSGSINLKIRSKKPIGAIIEQPGLYAYLNAWENLKIFAQIQGAAYDKVMIKEHLLRVGLPPERKDPVRNFSMGMKQRLGIAIALLNNPKILVLDEPFSGLDPLGVASLIKLIQEFSAQGISILLSSHLVGELYKCCDHLYVIHHGRIIHEGKTTALINSFVNSYTIRAIGIVNASAIKACALYTEKDMVTVQCDSKTISNVLKELLEENYKVTSCVPNISLEGFLTASSV